VQIFYTEMGEIGDRLNLFIDNQQISFNDLGEKIGVAGKSLKEMSQNKRPLGGNVLKKLGEVYPDLSLNWLFLGVGDMYLHKNEPQKNVQMVAEPTVHLYDTLDPVEEMFLKYLDRPMVQEKIKSFLKK